MTPDAFFFYKRICSGLVTFAVFYLEFRIWMALLNKRE